ncbi:hypothetical protein LTR85_008926 [Meristemomyces frigidus]|nr:hypothetical protein LTR85_008926 [Meristemomyces frigidus]
MAKRKVDADAAATEREDSAHEDRESSSEADRPRIKLKEATSGLEVHTRPTLLGLPAELRNQIYRYTLLSDDVIVIDGTNHDEPYLLHTSRQVRKEALSIYREENKFVIAVVDLRMELPASHWVSRVPVKRRGLDVHGKLSWANLLQWLEQYHSRQSNVGMGGNATYAMARVLGRAFRIVEALIKTPWATVEEVLEQWRGTVVDMEGSWRWAE